MYCTCEGCGGLLLEHVWLLAWTQQRVKTGESEEGPRGTQEDLGSSVISERQAAAMSPDYWFPMDLSRAISLSFSLSTSRRLWYASFQAFGFYVLARAKYKQTHTPSCTQTWTHTQATQSHGSTITPRRGVGTGSSLICLLHMFPIPVKLLPERDVTAAALTSGELNYLSHATFLSSTWPWH